MATCDCAPRRWQRRWWWWSCCRYRSSLSSSEMGPRDEAPGWIGCREPFSVGLSSSHQTTTTGSSRLSMKETHPRTKSYPKGRWKRALSIWSSLRYGRWRCWHPSLRSFPGEISSVHFLVELLCGRQMEQTEVTKTMGKWEVFYSDRFCGVIFCSEVYAGAVT